MTGLAGQMINDKLIDLSHYDEATFRPDCFYQQGVRRVIIGCYLPAVARRMITGCSAAGIEVVGLYGFCYFGPSQYYVHRDTDHAIALGNEFGIRNIWIDAEQDAAGISGVNVRVSYPAERESQLHQVVKKVRDAGFIPGIYTGGWWWNPNMNGSTAFKDLPLWHSQYGPNGAPRSPIRTVSYGGWTDVSIHQYTSAKQLCGRVRDWNYQFAEMGEETGMASKEYEELKRELADARDVLLATFGVLATNGKGTPEEQLAELRRLDSPQLDANLYQMMQNMNRISKKRNAAAARALAPETTEATLDAMLVVNGGR